jgi:hypothetical protein
MTARSTAQPIALFLIARAPPRTASEPPCHIVLADCLMVESHEPGRREKRTVKKPAMMGFHGSSFLRIPFIVQSYVLKRPPHTPKLPPRTGARAFMAVRAPILRSPYGLEFVCQL